MNYIGQEMILMNKKKIKKSLIIKKNELEELKSELNEKKNIDNLKNINKINNIEIEK